MSAVPQLAAPSAFVTVFRNKYGSDITAARQMTLHELERVIRTTPAAPDKGSCPLLKLATFGDARTGKGAVRSDDNVMSVSGAEGDYDGERMPMSDAVERFRSAGISALFYTSASHAPDAPRWRVILPFHHEYAGSTDELREARNLWLGVANALLGDVLTGESFVLSQTYFFGPIQGRPEPEIVVVNGAPIDTLEGLPPPIVRQATKPTAAVADDERRTADGDLAEIAAGRHIFGPTRRLTARYVWQGMTPTEAATLVRAYLKQHAGAWQAEPERWNEAHDNALRYAEGAAEKIRTGRWDGRSDPAPAEAANDAPARGPVLDWTALRDRDVPARVWDLQDWAPRGNDILFAGGGAAGKTTVALATAAALALGRDYFAHVPESRKVLVWSCEDGHDEIWRKALDVCRHFDVPLDALSGRLAVEIRKGCDNTLYEVVMGKPMWTPTFDVLREACNDHGADVLILDNVAHLFGGVEADRHQVTTYVNGCSRLAPTVVHLHHVARAAGSEFGGSAAWENAVRTRWYIARVLPGQSDEDEAAADPDVRWLARRKANYSAEDAVQLRWSNGVFVPVGDLATTQRSDARLDHQARETVLTGFRKLRDSGQVCSASTSSPDYLVRKLVDNGLTGGIAKQVLSRALARLRTDGVLTTGPVGHYSNRNTREGLIEVHK